MSDLTDTQDAVLMLVWARWADVHEPQAASLFRRMAKRLDPDVQVGDVVTQHDYSFNGARRQNPFAR